MLKGNQILRIGVIIYAVSLFISHSIGFSEAFTSFFMGMGCGLGLVGAGKHFIEVRSR